MLFLQYFVIAMGTLVGAWILARIYQWHVEKELRYIEACTSLRRLIRQGLILSNAYDRLKRRGASRSALHAVYVRHLNVYFDYLEAYKIIDEHLSASGTDDVFGDWAGGAGAFPMIVHKPQKEA